MFEPYQPFSKRRGIGSNPTEITIRNEAPVELREAIVMLAIDCGFTPNSLRDAICGTLLKTPDRNNWSPEPVYNECLSLIEDAPWHKVYDIAEKLIHKWAQGKGIMAVVENDFGTRLNEFFLDNGYGWKVERSESFKFTIEYRSSDLNEHSLRTSLNVLKDKGSLTAFQQLTEAIGDLSRRPSPDLTGAIHHAVAALECEARTFTGTSDGLGDIAKHIKLTAPLPNLIRAIWGYSSEYGRHVQEGKSPSDHEAEFIVYSSAALINFLGHATERPKN